MNNFINLTGEQISKRKNELKKKFDIPDVWDIKVPADDDGREIAVAFLKRPPRALMSSSMSFAEADPIKSDEILLEGIWLEGDERIKTNDDMFMTARALLPSIVKFRKGTIKKN